MSEKVPDNDRSIDLKMNENSDSTNPVQSINKKKIRLSSKVYSSIVILICLASAPVISLKYLKTKNESISQTSSIKDYPPKEISGSIVQILELDCGWEKSPQLENISSPSAVIPVLKINKVKFKSEGFLKVLFKSSSGKIQGDPQTIKINDNLVIRSTKGLENMLKFMDYKADDKSINTKKWTITLSESLDGNQWDPISTFKIPGRFVNGDS
ncbi:MAG: hypothetical protein CMO59_04320 [Verrucomicrobiales bacterium]|nr:hypothetical protein [Verrucomicrobiales bacterium]